MVYSHVELLQLIIVVDLCTVCIIFLYPCSDCSMLLQGCWFGMLKLKLKLMLNLYKFSLVIQVNPAIHLNNHSDSV